MVDVFISYSRANREAVSRLADAIAALGYAVWWDEELPAHLSYGDVITAKIHEAKATLVVWSGDSIASEWVRAEADLARNRKTLIQASIDGGTPPLPFNQIQYAAIGDWTGADEHKGWRKICASLAALCGPPVAELETAPPPPAPEPLAVIAAPAPVIAPAPVRQPAPRPVRKNRANRAAFVAIAASALTILTVGGLVLLKGPPAAIAQPVAAAPQPPAAAPAQPATPASRPPKAVIDVGVQDNEEAQDGAADGAQDDEAAE